LFESILTPIGTLVDKILVGLLSIQMRFKTVDEIVGDIETDTEFSLTKRGISPIMIDQFFTPFFQGIFLRYYCITTYTGCTSTNTTV
jgi:hypothetical protein